MTKPSKVPVVPNITAQLSNWIEGRSCHIRYPHGSIECCPDFSCCKSALLQPVEVRRAFADADGKGREKFRRAFLLGLIQGARPDVSVHITAGDPEEPS